jgi:hypothetical protein
MAGRTPPPGFYPVPGSKLGGWRKRVGKKWVYWYPDEKVQAAMDKNLAEAAKLNSNLRAAATKMLREAGVFHGDWTVLGFATDSTPHVWLEALVDPTLVSPKKVLYTARTQEISVENLPFGYVGKFHSILHAATYTLSKAPSSDTFNVVRETIKDGKRVTETVLGCPLAIVQAMAASWVKADAGSTIGSEIQLDTPGEPHYEADLFGAGGVEGAVKAPILFDRSWATAKQLAATARKAKTTAGKIVDVAKKDGNSTQLAAATKLFDESNGVLASLAERGRKYKQFREGVRNAVLKEKAGKISPNATLRDTEIYAAEAEFYAGAGFDLLKQMYVAGDKLSQDFTNFISLSTSDTSRWSNEWFLDSLQDTADAKPELVEARGHFKRGSDNAYYTTDDFGFPDLTIEYKEELARVAKAFATQAPDGGPFGLKGPHKNLKSKEQPAYYIEPFRVSDPDSFTGPIFQWNDVKLSAVVKRMRKAGHNVSEKAVKEFVEASNMLASQNVISVHYPDIAAHEKVRQYYARASAVLTSLATRYGDYDDTSTQDKLVQREDWSYQAKIEGEPKIIWRGIKVPEVSLAGITAGGMVTFPPASFSRKAIPGGVEGTKAPDQGGPIKRVMFFVYNPSQGVAIETVSRYEDELEHVCAGTYAVANVFEGIATDHPLFKDKSSYDLQKMGISPWQVGNAVFVQLGELRPGDKAVLDIAKGGPVFDVNQSAHLSTLILLGMVQDGRGTPLTTLDEPPYDHLGEFDDGMSALKGFVGAA